MGVMGAEKDWCLRGGSIREVATAAMAPDVAACDDGYGAMRADDMVWAAEPILLPLPCGEDRISCWDASKPVDAVDESGLDACCAAK